MNTLLIKNVLLNGRKTNILVKGNRFENLDCPSDTSVDRILEAEGTAILPSFFNTHTHAAMSLLRGYADDMSLDKWLTEYIWPFENKMTALDIRNGSELAVKEMIASGTTFFSDMYFDIQETIDIVQKYGIRAAIGITFVESHSKSEQKDKLDMLEKWEDPTGGRIMLTVAPHAVYTVSSELFVKCADVARQRNLKLHVHLSETEKEVADCKAQHGMTPVRYLDDLGVLGPNVIAAHVVHIDEEEAEILAERGVTVVHCPCSNMKLSSGHFNYALLEKAGCRVTIGTDGACSSNNLDMREAMKFAALLAKDRSGNPQLMSAEDAFRIATRNGAEAFGIDAGAIEKGKLADAVLVDMNNIKMQPCHNLISNWVYSADSSAVSHVLCDGKIIL